MRLAVFLKTTNGGQNWLMVNTQPFGAFSGDTWRRLDFVSMDVGYFYECCEGSERFYKTIDGCVTWATITETNPLSGPQVLKFYDENFGLVISQPAQIERTLDGGQTWEIFTTSHTGWGNDIEFDPFNPARVWFTDHKAVYASYDSEGTWRQFDWLSDDLKARDIAFNKFGEAWILADEGHVLNMDWLKKYNHNIHNEDYDFINAGEMLMWFANNGDGSHDPFTDGHGLYWPGGLTATKSAVFEDGLLWGGIVDGDTVVHGSTYRQGLQPGNILPNGAAADPDHDRFRIWRANAFWPAISDISGKRMEYDWNNWPADLGAPFIDNNGNGIYEPKEDNAVALGDETYWMVMNDLDTARTQFLYGCDPVEVEIQVSVYAFSRDNELRDIVFKQYKLINKSSRTIKDMYFSIWSDPDLGFAFDDFIGCDTLLILGYCYNGDNDDDVYGIPPAVGYTLLQGPITPGQAGDSAYFNQGWHRGWKNIDMNSFIDLTKLFYYPDPPFNKEGAYESYRYMRGINYNGDKIINPLTQEQTSFMVDGDPVNGIGWYEGSG